MAYLLKLATGHVIQKTGLFFSFWLYSGNLWWYFLWFYPRGFSCVFRFSRSWLCRCPGFKYYVCFTWFSNCLARVNVVLFARRYSYESIYDAALFVFTPSLSLFLHRLIFFTKSISSLMYESDMEHTVPVEPVYHLPQSGVWNMFRMSCWCWCRWWCRWWWWCRLELLRCSLCLDQNQGFHRFYDSYPKK